MMDVEWCVTSKITLQKPGCGPFFRMIDDRMIMVFLPFLHNDFEKTESSRVTSHRLYSAPYQNEQNDVILIIPHLGLHVPQKEMKLQYI